MAIYRGRRRSDDPYGNVPFDSDVPVGPRPGPRDWTSQQARFTRPDMMESTNIGGGAPDMSTLPTATSGTSSAPPAKGPGPIQAGIGAGLSAFGSQMMSAYANQSPAPTQALNTVGRIIGEGKPDNYGVPSAQPPPPRTNYAPGGTVIPNQGEAEAEAGFLPRYGTQGMGLAPSQFGTPDVAQMRQQYQPGFAQEPRPHSDLFDNEYLKKKFGFRPYR